MVPTAGIRRASLAAAIVPFLIPILAGSAFTTTPRQVAPPPASQLPTFRASTTLVEVDVIVKDAAGRFVGDLTAADFELSEDGAPQAIEAFYLVGGRPGPQGEDMAPPSSASSRAPGPVDARTIQRVFVIWFDVDHMAAGGVNRAKKAAAEFLGTDFKAGDIGGVVAGGKLVNGRLTNVREELQAAVGTVAVSGEARSLELTMQEWPRFLSVFEAYGVDRGDDKFIDRIVARAIADDPSRGEEAPTLVAAKGRTLTSAVRLSALQTLDTLKKLITNLARLPGRKTLIYLSDGFFSEDLAGQMQSALGQAAQANVRIYALDTRGLNRGSAASSILDAPPHAAVVNAPGAFAAELPQYDIQADGPNSLAVDTGGLMIRNENDFPKALREIGSDTSSYYVLGYRPAGNTKAGGFRSIGVKAKRGGLTVRARKGYLAGPASSGSSDATSSATAAAREVRKVEAAPSNPVVPEPSGTLARPDATGSSGPTAVVDPATIRLRPTNTTPSVDAGRLRDASRDAAPGTGAMPQALLDQARAGWAAYERGDTKAALTALAGPASHPGAPPWMNYVLGWSAFAEGEFAVARKAWNVVRDAVPDFLPVYFDVADACLRQRSPGEALAVLRGAEQRWPANPDVHNAVGVAKRLTGDLDGAIGSFRRAREAAPADPTSHFNLAVTLETRYVMSLHETTIREADRVDAIAGYRRVAQMGGPLTAAAQQGLLRLEPIDVREVTCAAPVRITEMTLEVLHGRPTRLAWSPDGRQIYVWGLTAASTSEGHVLVSTGDGSVRQSPSAPDWVRPYWLWKAAQKAPWLPALAIKSETKRFTNFNSVDAGDPGRAYAPAGGQTASNVLLLHGQTIAEASPGLVLPGLTFSWSPFAMGAIAFMTPRGRLVIMDTEGRTLDVPGAADVTLPGWSEDGTRIAYLKASGNTYALYVVVLTLSRP
jgi:VWFA-related protein